MRLGGIITLVLGVLIIMAVLFGYEIHFLKVIELIIGLSFLFTAIFKIPSVNIKIGDKRVLIAGEEAEEILNETVGEFVPFFKRRKSLTGIIGGIISGSVLILDSFDLIEKMVGKNPGFWELVLIIIAAYLIGYGVNSLVMRR